ncbi:MAG: hypothetical protein SFV15_04660 [Polyangiaceae bacterium]|nr:hypothetical protein [Polyangiaceae bacterium]
MSRDGVSLGKHGSTTDGTSLNRHKSVMEADQEISRRADIRAPGRRSRFGLTKPLERIFAHRRQESIRLKVTALVNGKLRRTLFHELWEGRAVHDLFTTGVVDEAAAAFELLETYVEVWL